MPRPNPYAKLNVLVCDGRLSQSQSVRDRYGGSYHPQALSVVDILDRLTGNKIHITRVDEIDDVVQKMKSHDTTHYALVVYASYHITNKSGGMKIQKVKDIDPFLPQVIYGQEITGDNLEKGYRRGIRYTARNIESLEETLGKIFWAPKDPLKNLAVVKVGGSSFDFEDENEESPNLGYVVEALLRIKNKIPENIGIPKHLTTPKQQIIEAVGAGQFGSKLLRHIKKYPETKKATPELIARALDTNLRLVRAHMDEMNYNFVQSEDFYFVDKDNARKIILMTIAPHYILARDQIPLQDSDSHMTAIAELYGGENVRVILIKRTDGVYDFDPYRGFVFDPINFRCLDLRKWMDVQQDKNKRHKVVTIEELLGKGISREGTGVDGNPDGSTGHLMEDSALEYFANCKNVKEILIVHIAPEEMHYPIGGNRYRHVVTGEEIVVDPATGWKGILEQRINDAFQGKALSKIVRG